MRTTIFSWGYYGWGESTTQLVRAVDAVEHSRGFEPPLFVDIRIRRAVRAAGFVGDAFAKVTGKDRYVWMKALGNRCIAIGAPGIQIDKPEGARDLLLRAVELAEERRRVLFFCSCEWPLGNRDDREDDLVPCHRHEVGELIMNHARTASRAFDVDVVEWPGGDPGTAALRVAPSMFQKVRRGRKSIPVQLESSADLAQWCGLPWGSTVKALCGDEILHIVSGPASCRKEQWQIPVFAAGSSLEMCRVAAADFRREHGLESGKSGQGDNVGR
jgi:hypothetical protein